MSGGLTLKLSVGELVAFACRSGDLSTSRTGGPSAAEGIRAHQQLQRKRPVGTEAEYPLEVEYQYGPHKLVLSGRVDLLHPQTDLHRPAQLDEIKTTYCAPEKLADSARALHWAQLKIYGFCYLLQQQVQRSSMSTDETHSREAPADEAQIALQMLWHDLKQKKTYPELRLFNWPELQAFACGALDRYISWQQAWTQHRSKVRASAQALDFPFPGYRPGQRELAVSAYRCLRDGGQLVVEAPTGIGKTISTLFPAIKAVGENQLDQLLYLTAKNSGRQVVRDTIAQLQQRGLRISLLEIQAKDKTCACRLGLCSPDADGVCPRTQGFFDRLPDARQQLLGQPMLTADTIAAVADSWQLCPFELSLQMLPWADLVVCDFNYVFDPQVQLGERNSSDTRRALLVDEAHNLIERARDMFSAELDRSGSRRAARACRGVPSLRRAIGSLVRALDKWVEERPTNEACDPSPTERASESWVTPLARTPDTHQADQNPQSGSTLQAPQAIGQPVQKILAVLSQMAEQAQSPPEEIREWLGAVYRYAAISEVLGEQHRCLTRRQQRTGTWQEQQVKLLCLNAAGYLQERYRQFHAVLLFSATLRPADYAMSQLGVAADTAYLPLPSPFSPSQLGVYLCPFVDTRYHARAAATDTLVELIARVQQSRPGNYLVFFPSYRFMQQVAEQFQIHYPDVRLIQQKSGANEQERADFLAHFNENCQSLGFAIVGGIFGEGVDYVGERLVGSILVGVGLPQVGVEQELLRRTHDESDCRFPRAGAGHGFDIAYRFPGLTRVLQAAGRVIRSESDRGVVILADARFADPIYRRLYPAHWQPHLCQDGEVLSAQLSAFWQQSGQSGAPMAGSMEAPASAPASPTCALPVRLLPD